MKKILAIMVFVAACSISQVQIKMPKVDTKAATSALTDFVKPPSIGDIGKTSSDITDMLSSKLNLPASQKTDLTSAISGFLTDKKGFAGLANTDPAGYLSKFNPLQQGLFGKLKGLRLESDLTKLIGLKHSEKNAAGDILSHLLC